MSCPTGQQAVGPGAPGSDCTEDPGTSFPEPFPEASRRQGASPQIRGRFLGHPARRGPALGRPGAQSLTSSSPSGAVSGSFLGEGAWSSVHRIRAGGAGVARSWSPLQRRGQGSRGAGEARRGPPPPTSGAAVRLRHHLRGRCALNNWVEVRLDAPRSSASTGALWPSARSAPASGSTSWRASAHLPARGGWEGARGERGSLGGGGGAAGARRGGWGRACLIPGTALRLLFRTVSSLVDFGNFYLQETAFQLSFKI